MIAIIAIIATNKSANDLTGWDTLRLPVMNSQGQCFQPISGHCQASNKKTNTKIKTNNLGALCLHWIVV